MQEGDDSYIITDGRKSTPRVFFPSDEEINLRYRYSSSSSSNSSITPKCFNQHMASMTSTPYTKDPNIQGFSPTPTPGIIPDYGSFQPTSYTEAYVPPLSLRRNLMTDFTNGKLEEEHIRIDSGYNDGFKRSSSSTLPSVNHSSLRPVSTSSWWDSIFSVSVQNFRQRLNGNDRSRFIDEGQRRRCRIKPQQIVASFMLLLVLFGIGFFLWISNNSFKFIGSGESKNNSLVYKDTRSAQAVDLESAFKLHEQDTGDQIGNAIKESGFLLPENSTLKHVEMLKNQLEAKFEAKYNSELSEKVNETAEEDVNRIRLEKVNGKGKGDSRNRN